MGLEEAKEYVEEDLGFKSVDLWLGDRDHLIVGEKMEDSKDFIFVNFDRKTVFKWASGYDPTTLIGKGLTKKEEKRLYELDMIGVIR